jgi:anti-sigma regulatory factor (Ser/Thr protein kinase)
MTVVRTFASSVARHLDLADDLVDDLKLAVSEACADPIEAGTPDPIELEVGVDDRDVRVSVTSRAMPAAIPDVSRDLPSLDRFQLVRALFEDATREVDGGRCVVRFSTAERTRTAAGGSEARR